MSRLSRQLFAPLWLGLSLAWAPLTPAAEIDLLANALGFADCLEPPLSAPAGLGAQVICGTRLYGPSDEFVGQTDLLTRGGWINPGFRLGYLRAARPVLERTAAQDPSKENRFDELFSLLTGGGVLESGEFGVFRGLLQAAALAEQAGDVARAAQLRSDALEFLEAERGDFDHPNITRELIRVLLHEDGFALLGSSEFPALLARGTRDEQL